MINGEGMQRKSLSFGTLINQLNDAVFVADPETGFILDANNTACSNLGYEYRELLDLRVPDVDAAAIPGDFAWKEHVKEVRRKGYMLLESAHKRKDGTTFPVEINVRYVETDKKAYMIGVARDITERKQLEESLRKSEQKLSDITSSLAEGIYVMDLKGHIIFMNPEAERLLGWTISELSDKNAHETVHFRKADSSPLPLEQCRMYKVIENGIRFVSSEEVFVRKDGTVFPISVICSPVTENGKRVASVTAFRDITERKNIEKDREKLIYELGITNEDLEREIAERKRVENVLKSKLSLSQYSDTHTLDDIMQATLDEAEMVTQSRIGFFHFVEPDQITLSLQNWSTATLRQCTASGKGQHYPISEAGVWTDCIRERRPIIHNDYASLQHKRGTPEGHVPVIRELVVPIFQGEKIVAVIGVGNKLTDYLPEDVGYVTQLASLAWDIVQRKRAEEALRQNEEKIRNLNKELEQRVIERTAQLKESAQRFQLAAESGQLGVWDWNVVSNFMVWNNRMFELYGISRDAFPDSVESWVNGLHPDDSTRAIAECDAALRGEKEFDTEFRALHPDGKVKVLKANAIVIRDAGGKAVRMLGLNRDITELREAEEKLRGAYSDLEIKVQERTAELTAAKHQLEELNLNLEQKVREEIASRQEKEQLLFQQSRMAAMGEMIGAIAHQWRQPLNVIGLIIQNMQMAYEYGEIDKERLRNAVATAMWQINFMSKTIDDFRNFFKPSKEKEVFDVRKMADETIALMKAQLQNNYIDVEIIAEKKGLVINGYPNEFKHVLMNLINNAKDAILELKAKEKCRAKITIRISEKAGKVIVEVRDTGGGIPEGIMNKIFDPYFTTKDEGTGTGIGLYISKTMIERNMGGQLTAKNWEEGAEFRIEV